jgi:hypothetical protein
LTLSRNVSHPPLFSIMLRGFTTCRQLLSCLSGANKCGPIYKIEQLRTISENTENSETYAKTGKNHACPHASISHAACNCQLVHKQHASNAPHVLRFVRQMGTERSCLCTDCTHQLAVAGVVMCTGNDVLFFCRTGQPYDSCSKHT